MRLNSLTSTINDPFTALNDKNDTVTSLTSNCIVKDGITVDALLASQPVSASQPNIRFVRSVISGFDVTKKGVSI